MNYNFFDVTPRIFRVGTKATFTIHARYEQRFFNDGEFILRYQPGSGVYPDGKVQEYYAPGREVKGVELRDNQTLDAQYFFNEEGEYLFNLIERDEEGKEREITSFTMYALKDDLFALRPYKGDIHNHSSYSECGCRDDNPRYVAAIARYSGLDFFSISDHMQRLPSTIAMDFVEQFKTEYKLFPAQELHMLFERVPTLFCRNRFLPFNHIVAWGIEQDIAREMNDNFEQYILEVTGRAAAITDTSLSEDVKFICAGADWICDKIHEYGGIAVFCHPFWKPRSYNLPAQVREYILANHKWDVIEVVPARDDSRPDGMGGITTDSIWETVSWWQEASIKAGKMLPLVGITDTHDVEQDERGKHFTLVFAKDASFTALSDAMKSGNSLGAIKRGNDFIFIGHHRLVQFAYFLAREMFREHDDICRTEGSMMREYLNGECTAEAISEYADGRITRLFQKYYGE
jgi:hypothetical protein